MLQETATPARVPGSLTGSGTGSAPSGTASVTAFRAVLRAIRPLVGQGAVDAAGTGLSLERLQRAGDPPSVSACRPLEPGPARRIPIAEAAGISAFLDGIQRSRVVGHLNGSPLVHGTVAAVVRRRENRKLDTWREPRVRSVLLGARPQIGEEAWQQLAETGVDIRDICEGEPATGDGSLAPHPMAVRARALDLIALERETIERHLAADWCRDEHEWLWIDGGIAGNLAVSETSCAFGVVKSHTTLYGDADAIRRTLALRAGERSSAFLAGHRPRRAVASWYLRLRDSTDGDPLHGLVRVEVAPPAALTGEQSPDDVALARFTRHADQLSSWILAEGAPLSLPDPRWDTLTYGVHACEAYLKAIVGS